MKHMNYKYLILVITFSLLLVTGCKERNNSTMTEKSNNSLEFKSGQVWAYKTRPQEKDSLLTILLVEKVDKIMVVHVRLDGLIVKNYRAPNGFSKEAEHIPFTVEALSKSVVKIVAQKDPLPLPEGYSEWQRASGGAHTITVAEAVESLERLVNSPD